jgi:hypothetical protein
MRGPSAHDVLGYLEAAELLGLDRLNGLIADERLIPIRLNDRPGAPSVFNRSAIERLARGS